MPLLLLVLLLHLALLFLLMRQTPFPPPALPSRVFMTTVVPRPPPPVDRPPAPHVDLMQPILAPFVPPRLDIWAKLPAVGKTVTASRPPASMSSAIESVATPNPGTGAGPGNGPGHGAGTPCLPCVWQWEQRLVHQIQSVIHAPHPPVRADGAVRVRLRMMRSGSLLSADLVAGSGHEAFDREAMLAAWRASPLPPAPADVKDDPVVLVVPVHFSAGRQ